MILPKGRYWFTVNRDDKLGTWLGWLDAFKDSVHVENTSSRPEEDGSPAWDFYIFSTSKDLLWERSDHPTKAGPEIQSVADTVQRPEPIKDIPDVIVDTLHDAPDVVRTAAVVLGLAAFGLGALFVLTRRRR